MPVDGWIYFSPLDADSNSQHYAPTAYANAAHLAEAAVITVRAGEERDGVLLSIRSTPTRNLFGTAFSDVGPAPNVTVSLVSIDPNGDSSFETAIAVTDSRGAFAFLHVPTGSYTLRVLDVPHERGPAFYRPADAAESALTIVAATDPWSDVPTLWASENVTIGDRDVHDVPVRLKPGLRIAGTVTFLGRSPRPTARSLQQAFEIERTDGGPKSFRVSPHIAVNERLEFTSVQFPPGRYFLRAPRPPKGWILKSATYRGRDISLQPVELDQASAADVSVVFSDLPSGLLGTARTQEGKPDASAAVVAFPTDTAALVDYGEDPPHIRAVRADSSGRYSLEGLPPGEYWVAAIPNDWLTQWHSPALFAAVTKLAERQTISDGQRLTVDLITKK